MAQFSGQGPAGLPSGGTQAMFTTPYPMRVGQRARDVDGNEYVFCDFGAAVSPGIWVTISAVHVANPVVSSQASPIRVGVVCGGPGPIGTELTSNMGGWVQIYGLCNFALTNEASDVGTTFGVLAAGKVATSPAGTVGYVSIVSLDANRIYGAWDALLTPVAAGISGTTDASFPTTYVTAVTDNAGLGLGHTGTGRDSPALLT